MRRKGLHQLDQRLERWLPLFSKASRLELVEVINALHERRDGRVETQAIDVACDLFRCGVDD